MHNASNGMHLSLALSLFVSLALSLSLSLSLSLFVSLSLYFPLKREYGRGARRGASTQRHSCCFIVHDLNLENPKKPILDKRVLGRRSVLGAKQPSADHGVYCTIEE